MSARWYRFLLIGDPVEHSRSPVMHREALRRAGLDGEYDVLRADGAGLAEVVEGLRQGESDGVNVTMPLKTAAWEAADTLTPEAEEARSVNALRSRRGVVEGHSTDVVAFARAYAAAPEGAPLLVLGAGASARAALAAWRGGDVFVSGRDTERVKALAGEEAAVPWGEFVDGAVVVNATPLGMRGEALPRGPVEQGSLLIDLPYGPKTTPAVQSAQVRGLAHVDGIGFLAAQAAASFEWWTGAHVDSDALAEAGRNA